MEQGIEGDSVNLAEWVDCYPPQLIHALAAPVLIGYDRLADYVKKGKVFLAKGSALVYQKQNRIVHYIGSNEVQRAPRANVRISQTRIPGATSHKETITEIEEVFNRDSYSSKKSWYNHVRRPLNIIEREEFSAEPITSTNVHVAVDLHAEWRDYKLAQPKTYRMGFPTARYRRVVELALAHPNLIQSIMLLVKWKEEPVGYVVVYVHGKYAYNMAAVSAWWREPISELADAMQVLAFQKALESGCTTFCSGRTLNKSLGAFKHKWPSNEVKYYESKEAL